MKNIITILFAFILITSCKDNRVEKLNNRISELEILNKKLLDSLSRNTHSRLLNSVLWGIPEKKDLSANKPNNFKFIFSSLQKLPAYNVYAITKKGDKKSSVLIYENHIESQFEYNFIPKNEKDNSFEIKTLFNLDSIVVEIPGVINISK
jgi:hypothetical protein